MAESNVVKFNWYCDQIIKVNKQAEDAFAKWNEYRRKLAELEQERNQVFRELVLFPQTR